MQTRKEKTKSVLGWRIKNKLLSISCFGNQCGICGYNKCLRALEFHHIDPSTKSQSVSSALRAWSFDNIRVELKKCICVCSNCHKEIHSGLTEIPKNIRQFDDSHITKPIPEEQIATFCLNCGKQCNRPNQRYCSYVCSGHSRSRTTYPEKMELLALVKTNGFCSVARTLHVSDNAVRKRLQKEFGMSMADILKIPASSA